MQNNSLPCTAQYINQNFFSMGRSRRLSEQILVHLSKKDTERKKFSSVKQQGKASRENLRGTKSSVVLRGTKALRGKALGGVKGGTERYKGK